MTTTCCYILHQNNSCCERFRNRKKKHSFNNGQYSKYYNWYKKSKILKFKPFKKYLEFLYLFGFDNTVCKSALYFDARRKVKTIRKKYNLKKKAINNHLENNLY